MASAYEFKSMNEMLMVFLTRCAVMERTVSLTVPKHLV